jgi:hypothetical protein
VIENALFRAVESIGDFVLFEVVEAVLVVILVVILVVSTLLVLIVVVLEADMVAGIADCSCIELDKVDRRRCS